MASSSKVGFERDSSVRYIRYSRIIMRKGETTTVYNGFDRITGKEIAWSTTQLTENIIKENRVNLVRLCREGDLMKLLDHENIVKCYLSRINEESATIQMITEYFPSGNLVQYLSNHKSELQDYTAIKKWCRQILNAIDYLHSRSPPIIHNRIKCESIYVDGKTGNVKIGDFCSASFLDEGGSKMEDDILCFGLTVLEMITRERPDYRDGDEAEALRKVTDPVARDFISNCVGPESVRQSAKKLLNHRFVALSFSERYPGLIRFLRRVCCCISWPAVDIWSYRPPLLRRRSGTTSTAASQPSEEQEQEKEERTPLLHGTSSGTTSTAASQPHGEQEQEQEERTPLLHRISSRTTTSRPRQLKKKSSKKLSMIPEEECESATEPE